MSEKELDGDVDTFGPDSYDGEWLARPVSFVVCTLPEGRKRRQWNRKGDVPSRPTFFGSLPDLLAHQHEHHAGASFTDKQSKKREEDGLVGHFYLPPLVVSALATITELAQVEDDAATVDDLVSVTRNTEESYSWDVSNLIAYLVWENASGFKHNYAR